jgi:hypothetical protein
MVGAQGVAESKKPFSCPNFGAELWRIKNMNVFMPPKLSAEIWSTKFFNKLA